MKKTFRTLLFLIPKFLMIGVLVVGWLVHKAWWNLKEKLNDE